MEILAPQVPDLDQVAEMIHQSGQKLILLSGDLGCGKTTLVQRFCKYIGSPDEVSSPSFSLINEYRYKDSGSKEYPIYHIDLYRIKNLQEALDIGILEYIDSGAYCFIEWPECIESILPEDFTHVKMEILPDTIRKIRILIMKDVETDDE